MLSRIKSGIEIVRPGLADSSAAEGEHHCHFSGFVSNLVSLLMVPLEHIMYPEPNRKKMGEKTLPLGGKFSSAWQPLFPTDVGNISGLIWTATV